jgi:hypothetical protein
MKISKYLVLLFLLASCAHHPGDCALGGAFGALHDDCLPGTAGYEQNRPRYAAAEAKERSKKIAVILNECSDKYHNGELKTHMELYRCSDARITAAYQDSDYGNMDLFYLFEAKRQELAQQLDDRKITKIKARIKLAELQKEWSDEERERNLEAFSAAAQAAQGSYQQGNDASALLLGIMAQPQPAPQPYAMPVRSAPSVINTTCNGFGNSINCTSYR